jgi:hypothetical protein
VGLEPAVRRLLEGEGEGVELLVRAQPDEAALAQVDVGLVGAAYLVRMRLFRPSLAMIRSASG